MSQMVERIAAHLYGVDYDYPWEKALDLTAIRILALTGSRMPKEAYGGLQLSEIGVSAMKHLLSK